MDGIEKSPTEYNFHLDCDIFTVVNVFKTYRCVHILHYRDETLLFLHEKETIRGHSG